MGNKINFREMLTTWWKQNVLGDDLDGKRPSNIDLTNKMLETYGMYQIFKYDMFDVKRDLYLNDTSISFCLEIIPQTGSNEDFVSRLVNILSTFPSETSIQLMHFGNTIFDEDLQEYLDLRLEAFQKGKTTDFGVEFAKNRIKHVLSKKGRPQFGDESFYVLKKPKLVLSVSRTGSWHDKKLIRQMSQMVHSISAQLKQAMLPNQILTPRLLMSIIKPLLNPIGLFQSIAAENNENVPRSYSSVQYNPLDSIKTQLTPLGHSAEVNPREIIFGEKDRLIQQENLEVKEDAWWEQDDDDFKEDVDDRIGFRAFGVTAYPKVKHLYEMSNIIGDFFDNTQQYPSPFVITAGIYILDRNSSETTARVKHARAKQNAESKIAKWQPEYAEIARDWDAIVHHMHKGGTMCEMYHTVGIFAPKNKLDDYSLNVKNLWKSNGFKLEVVDYLQLPFFYMSMPMTLNKKAREDLKKMRMISTKTTINAIDMLPLLSEWQGFGKPIIMCFGRRGVPTFFDLFSNKQGNYNYYVCGVSGAGKSVFCGEIVNAYKSLGFKIYIIDVGRSYRNFVAFAKGITLDFTRKANICMNPFSSLEIISVEDDSDNEGTLNTFEQELKMILPMYAKMCAPEAILDPYEKAILIQALTQTWHIYGQENGVDQVSDYLKTIQDHTGGIDPIGWKLGVQLESFRSTGMYGQYFNGKANINLNNDTIYLELEELKDSPDLKTVVLLGVMNQIMRDMYLSRDRGKMILLDEAWQLLDESQDTADFIEEGYRRARKYFGSFGMGTQGIDDAFKNDAARAAYNSADWKFYLRQDPESFAKLIADGKVNFSQAVIKQIESLETAGGRYSEIMVTSPNGRHIVRHLADPFSLALASTNADDYMFIEECINKGMTTTEAVYALMKIKEEAA